MSQKWIVVDHPELRERLKTLKIPESVFYGHWSSEGNENEEELKAVLEWRDAKIQLRPLDKALGNPITVEFTEGKTGFRFVRAQHEMIVKAVAGRSKDRLTVLDATAGLGRDSFILAAAGFQVISCERNPVIACLLKDGLDRATMSLEGADVVNRIHLLQQDAGQYLDELEEQDKPDVICVDPMFPERSKSALVKKEMRIFRDIVGDDMDAETLLQKARQVARKRVVVKRPRKAESIGQLKPSYQLLGKSSRFDIYQV